jgi:hypothetical protein
MNKTLDLQKLHELELLACGGRCPGTILQRVLVDNTLLKGKAKIPKDKLGREATIIWSLGVGYLSEPKVFYWGWTPDECLEKAWKDATKRADKARTKFVMDTLASEREAEGLTRALKNIQKDKKARKR